MTNNTPQINNEYILAEAMPHGIVILQADGEIKWWNHIASDLINFKKINCKIKTKRKYITDIISKAIYQKLLNNENEKGLEIQSPWQQDQYLSILLRPYKNNQTLLIIQDITHTHILEKMRQDFIANVSHELGTPLTVFHGYLEIMQNYAVIEKEQYAEMLQHMVEQSQRMESLVKDLLLLARLESNEPDMNQHQQVDIALMLSKICDDAKLLSGKKQHHFSLHLDKNLQLIGQADELRSAFSNLIYNAVHYTPAHGKIDIHWYQDKTGKHVKIIDTGIGIPEKYLPRITQRFYRVDKSRSKGGTGLGLAIVKHVLLRHGGQLNITSKVNKGSTFCCTFFT